MYLSWIIPAYNEERRIGKTLREVDAYLRSRNFPGGCEILVADSSSRDRTAAVVEALRVEVAHLGLLSVANRGKGWAVKQGMLAARGDIRLFSDADNSTAPEYFDAMVPLFRQGYDVVISSRDPRDAPGASRDVREPWYRELMGNLGNLVIQLVGGAWGVWDTQNGFKAFTAETAEALFVPSRISGFAFDVELLALARRLGFRVATIPVRWRFDPESKVTLASYLEVLRDVLRIRWNLIRGVYRLPI